ncbi:MAG: hypothetical protein SVM86_02925 [Candidatus Cloacimonadota bacterium]|nr:hypothetical protein [Candidatus Cloacimonadota bacterium]
MNNFTIKDIIGNGIKIGFANFLSLLVAYILWLITVWIPYLNVGTTIAIYNLVPAMAKGKVISPTEIFKAKYRKNMGEFFLTIIFISMGVTIGSIFFFLPGIVIGIAWSLAIFLVIDKNMQPLEAIKTSNNLTYGKKWQIFFTFLITPLILLLIPAWIGGLIAEALGTILLIIGFLIYVPVCLGIMSYIYKTLLAETEVVEKEVDTKV